MAILCLDIGGSFIKGGIFVRNKLLEEKEVKSFVDNNIKKREDFLFELDEVINYFLNKYSKEKFESINIGIPGPFKDKKKGIMGRLKNLPLKNFNLKNYLGMKFGIKIFIENDANCFALGEYCFGGYKCKNLAGVTLGTGLGLGIVDEGKIVKQVWDNGEFSDIKYEDSIIEDYVSKRGLIRFAKDKGFEIFDTKDLAHEKYKEVWDEFSLHLSFALAIVIEKFKPEVIVLGGKIAKSSRFFRNKLFQLLEEKVNSNLPVIYFEKKNLALYGALTLVENNS